MYAVIWETPHFETNDDVWMMLTLSGQVTSLEPTASIIFMNLFLCRALTGLYHTAPSVPWYGLMHVGGIIIAVEVMLYALIIRGGSFKRILLFVLCLVSFGLPLLIRLQFTKTSFLVGLSGIFLLYATLMQPTSPRITPGITFTRLLGAALLLTLSFLIRKESLYLLLLLSVPVLLQLAWQTWRARTLSLLLPTTLAVGLLLAVFDYSHQRTYAQDSEWRRFNELLRLKSQFIDYNGIPYNAESQPYFTAVGWSENDYQMLMRWFYIDPVRYSPEHLRAIIAHFPTLAKPPAHIRRSLLVMFFRLRGDGTLWITVPLLLGIVLLGLRKGNLVSVLLATTAVAGAVMVMLMVFLKLPERLYQPIIMAVCWFAMLIGEESPSPIKRRQVTWGLNACGIVFVVLALISVLTHDNTPLKQAQTFSRLTVRDNRALRAALLELAPQPSQTFVSWGGAFPYEAILPLENKDYLKNFHLIGLGASNQSPLQRRTLEVRGITDLHRALFERDDVFIAFLPSTVSEDQGLLTTYLAQHYDVQVTITPTFQEGPLHFWQVRRASTEPAHEVGQKAPESRESFSLSLGRRGSAAPRLIARTLKQKLRS